MKNLTKNNIIILFIVLIIISATFVFVGILNFKSQYKTLSKEILFKEAVAHYNNMVNTRLWNANFGGLFVYQTNNLKPNKYLKNNHIYSKNDELLIKINPAWMTKQISKISNKNSKYFYKITSLNPINPDNKADLFEEEALSFFEKNKKQKFYSTFENNNYNFMGSLVVKEACLKCHAEQGYKLGDIRGGLRISIPLDSYKDNISLIEDNSSIFMFIVILFVIVSIGIIIYFVNIIYKKQNQIEVLNNSLESKVTDRTNKINSMYENEKYLKDVLKLIANVNEMLVISNSFNSIIKNSIDKLIQHEQYKFIWSGLYYNNEFEVVYKSEENSIIYHNSIEKSRDKQLLEMSKKAIETGASVVYKLDDLNSNRHRRSTDIDFIYNICIPYVYNDMNGIMSIYTNVEDGFKEEEIDLLEQIVNDISISLKNQIHLETILQMEDERIANYEETILAFVNIIEERDSYTAGHTIRVAEYCKIIAQELNVNHVDIKRLEKSAILHDIGKVAIPDAILLKPGKLTSLEYELIKYHSEAGYKMLLKIDMYKDLAEIIRYHHSRYDGKGYPETKSPDEIPFLSHIMIVADAFDAMTTNRIYKPRKEIAEALEEVEKGIGTQFHPEVTRAAIKGLKNICIEDTTQLPSGELEEKRFSYFFQDSLTGLYNENYLEPLLVREEGKLNFLYHINQHNFSSFNEKEGWDKGSNLLIELASALSNKFTSEYIFRFHGDDFIILSRVELEKKEIYLTLDNLIKNSSITVDIEVYNLDSNFNIEQLH